MKKILFILLIMSIFIIGCSQVSNIEKNNNPEEPRKLTVYLSAIPHGFISSENSVEADYILYPSKHTIGTMEVGGELNYESGNVFEHALRQYEKESNVTIEIHYIEEDSMTDQVLQEKIKNNETLPDLMILGKHNHYDYIRLAEQGCLLDFAPLIEQDDEINDSEKYFGQVINGGEVNGKQIAIPLLFNLNAFISSTDFLTYCGLDAKIKGPSYEEIIHMLKQACSATENTTTLAVYETSGNMVAGTYLPSILTGSAYAQYYDSTLNKVLVEEEVIKSILEVMELYNRQDFCYISDWEKNTYIDNVNDPNCKSQNMSFSVDSYNGIGVFLTGGRCGGLNYHNSILTDVAFFNTIYESKEEWTFWGIPTVESQSSYSANISLAAYAFANTEYPEEVYKLVRYLMDYEFPVPYGFSINKQVTERQLENSKTSYTKVYPSYIWGGVTSGMYTLDEIESDSIVIEPLDSEMVGKIEYMLDNIAGAGLPYGFFEYSLYSIAIEQLANGQISSEEAANWIIDIMKGHLNKIYEIDPIYDIQYMQTIEDSIIKEE